jgi:hypothetical protein
MQALMKSNRTRLRASIVDNVRSHHERGHTRDCDNMAMILLDHCRQEFSYHPEVRDGVDLECLLNDLFRALQNGEASANSSIIDQDRWLAMLFADLCSSRSNLLGIGDIALIEVKTGSFLPSATTHLQKERSLVNLRRVDLGVFKSKTTTLTPLLANSSAISFPIPLQPPEISTSSWLFINRASSFQLFAVHCDNFLFTARKTPQPSKTDKVRITACEVMKG